MPKPAPKRVAANVSTEDIRREYYDSAPWSNWIVEMHLDPLQLIVCDDHSGRHYRVPVTATEEKITFGPPVEVAVEYVDRATYDAAPAASSRLVFASRRDSRPGAKAAGSSRVRRPARAAGQPAAPAVTGERQPMSALDRIRARRAAAQSSTQDPTGRRPAAGLRRLPSRPRANTAVPAAEPEPTHPTKEDTVSDLSAFRSRLGLPDTADEAAVLAAIDALEGATTTEDGTTIASLTETVTQLKEQVAASTKELADRRTAEADARKASVLDTAQKAGKFRPADREAWAARYDKAPEVTVEVLDAIAAGAAVPVTQSGHIGEPETNTAEDAMFDRLFAPAATRTPVGAGTASKEV